MSVLENGINKIYDECLEEQTHFIKTICREVRNRELDILFDMKAFYVPNDEFMIKYFGPSIMSANFDCYDYLGSCKWKYHLVIPIRDVFNKVVGFSGYNPYVTLARKDLKARQEDATIESKSDATIEDSNVFSGGGAGSSNPSSTVVSSNNVKIDNGKIDITSMSRYKESSSVLMDKSRYFICPLGYEKALNDGYLIVVDGFFDSISLAQEGFNSFSILGSNISEKVRFCLSLIKVIYVAYDNDGAGRKLYNRLKAIHPNVHAIVQSKCKDIDAFIKEYPNEFRIGMEQIHSKIPMSFSLKA